MSTGDNVQGIEGGLKGWPNDDLCLEESARKYLNEQHPRYAPIFVADDLAELFRERDVAASHAKRRARRGGYWAVGLGFSSIVLASLTPLLVRATGGSDAAARTLGLIVVVAAVLSFLVGHLTLLFGKNKIDWMTNRMWTERIRQFHFQFIVNNLTSALQAAASGDYNDWRALRRKALQDFCKNYMKSPAERLIALLRDAGEQNVWVSLPWRRMPALSDDPRIPDEIRNEFWTVYRGQRFGIQQRYTRLALADGPFGAEGRAKTIWGIGQFFTILAVGMSVALAGLFAFGGTPDVLPVQIAQAGLGISGAFVLAARSLEEGLQASAEKERLESYLATAAALESLYEQASSLRERVEVMRDMERLSYLEMRRFFIAVNETKFVM